MNIVIKIINTIIDIIIYLLFGKKSNNKKLIKGEINIKNVFTNSERIFFNNLKKELENFNINIFTKVRLIDFININKNLNNSRKQTIINKINKKHIDFLICDEYGNIKLLIELDGKSHYYDKKTINNDNMKNYIFKELGINLLRYKVGEKWNFEEIKKLL